jgi:hypothetical protein
MEVTWRHTADRHVGFEILHIDMDSISIYGAWWN